MTEGYTWSTYIDCGDTSIYVTVDLILAYIWPDLQALQQICTHACMVI